LAGIGYSQAVAREFDAIRFYPATKDMVPLVMPLNQLGVLEKNILKSGNGLTIIDFYAHTCPSCMHMLPVLERIANRYADLVAVYAVDFDAAPDIAATLGVTKVPTLLVFNDGKLVDTVGEPLTYSEFATLIEARAAI
jgi:thioredoxin-like negative regulator of GroEL